MSSGPILKPGNFFPQLRETSPLPQDTAAGLYAIGLGLAKKVLLADSQGRQLREAAPAVVHQHAQIVRQQHLFGKRCV